MGRRHDEDVYALYRAADLYVSFSRHEGFGMPLVEAMAFDLPVLAHSAGSIAATLGPGGLILNDATPQSLIREMIVAGDEVHIIGSARPDGSFLHVSHNGLGGWALGSVFAIAPPAYVPPAETPVTTPTDGDQPPTSSDPTAPIDPPSDPTPPPTTPPPAS